MKKNLIVGFALAVAAFATTASAQGGMAGMDMTKKVAQVGPHPDGWLMRNDDPKETGANDNFTVMGPGMHVEGGPAAIYWNPANTASGDYTISVTLGARSIPLHDADGIIWGGNDLSGDKESYGYFLVYGDGSYIVKHRSGAATHIVVPKGSNAAIKAADKNGGSASNKLAVKVAADSVRFFANDVQVAAVDAKNGMAPNAGIYGVRVNHNISVHIAGLAKH